MTSHVALFAKPPRPGAVKTRLSPALPAADAATLAAAFLEDAAARVVRVEGARRILYLDESGAAAPGDPAPVPSDRTAAFDEVRLQRGADLGERLARAFSEMLREPDDRAVVIGVDSPDLPDDTLRLALGGFARADAVVGPARDGGYYLIGLSGPRAELFTGVEWGSPRVLEQTRARARSLGLRLEELRPWWDVDEPADLAALIARMLDARTRALCPATAAALVALGFLPPHTTDAGRGRA